MVTTLTRIFRSFLNLGYNSNLYPKATVFQRTAEITNAGLDITSDKTLDEVRSTPNSDKEFRHFMVINQGTQEPLGFKFLATAINGRVVRHVFEDVRNRGKAVRDEELVVVF